jgi:branched-subunit amino acid ABC-type transport system permease component
MSNPTPYVLPGLIIGAVYGLTGMGVVLTYRLSKVVDFALGALATFCAFTFWQLHVSMGWSSWIAIPLSVVALPIVFAVTANRLVYRPLRHASTFARCAGSVGVMLLLFGMVELFWSGPIGLNQVVVPSLFPSGTVEILGDGVTVAQIGTVLSVVAISAVLYTFLHYTRLGREIRATVSNEGLAQLRSVSVKRTALYGWCISSMMAGFAGLLIAPLIGSDPILITELVVISLSAAILGGLRSLPIALAGGLVYGILSSLLVGYVPASNGSVLPTTLGTVIPFVVLFFVLILRYRSFQDLGSEETHGAFLADLGGKQMPSFAMATRSILLAGVFAMVLGLVLAALGQSYWLVLISAGVITAIVFLSMQSFTATTGLVCLAPAALAGIGAFTSCLFLEHGWPWVVAIVLGGVAAAFAGAVLALLTLRLRGIFFVIATIAFGQIVAVTLFTSTWFTGGFNGPTSERPEFFGSDKMYLLLSVLVFCILAVGVEWFRRSFVSSRLMADLESTKGAISIGVVVGKARVLSLALSGAIAGIAGGLFAANIGTTSVDSWSLIVGLTWLTVVAIGGVGSSAGMLVIGVGFGGFVNDLIVKIPAISHSYVAILAFLSLLVLRRPGGAYALQEHQMQWIKRAWAKHGTPAVSSSS